MRIRLSRSGDIEIVFAYEAHLVELVKTLPDRSWDKEQKLWRVPRSCAKHAVEVLRPYGFAVDSEVEGLAEEIVEEVRDAISVLELNQMASRALATAFQGALWVVGELAEWDRAMRSHAPGKPLRFALVARDEKGKEAARVQAVLFDNVWARLEAKIAQAGSEFGMTDEVDVRVRVRPQFYAKGGTFQVQVDDIDVAYTLGEALRRRDDLIRRLIGEGLDRINPALPVPIAPLRVGLVTRVGSDAYHDVHQTLHQSGFAFELVVSDARVQGVEAERTLLEALARLNELKNPPDVVLICRGGGARLDLAAFDSEKLARAVAAYPIPVIVGVGHDQDRSVLDAVARSARTPVAAAEIVVGTVEAFAESLRAASRDIGSRAHALLGFARREVDALHAEVPSQGRARLAKALAWRESQAKDLRLHIGGCLSDAERVLAKVRSEVGMSSGRSLERARGGLQKHAATVAGSARGAVGSERGALARAKAELPRVAGQGTVRHAAWLDTTEDAISLADPKRVLALGYAILRREAGSVVRSASEMREGETVTAELGVGKRALTVGTELPAASDQGERS